MNISSNLSSIQAHQTSLNSTANNIANVNSENFSPSDTTILSDTQKNVQANISKTDNNIDLTKEIPNEILSLNGAEVNVEAIKAKDDILGTLLDIKA